MITPSRPRAKGRSAAPKHPFDLLHGTSTGSLIPGDDLASGHANDRHITAYHGTAPSLFRKLLAHWQQLRLHPVERTAFVDIGAGKGRALLLAADLPFRRIAGVELHPALAADARRNIGIFQRSRSTPPISIAQQDVMRFRIPAGPCLFFLFNPFGAVLLDRFLAHLARSFQHRPTECDLLYVNDEWHGLMAEEHPRFRQIWRGRVHLSVEDRQADKATIQHDAAGLYVTSGYEDCSIYRLQ